MYIYIYIYVHRSCKTHGFGAPAGPEILWDQSRTTQMRPQQKMQAEANAEATSGCGRHHVVSHHMARKYFQPLPSLVFSALAAYCMFVCLFCQLPILIFIIFRLVY